MLFNSRWLYQAVTFLALSLAATVSSADVLFEDGFESGNFTTGGWTTSGSASVDTSYNYDGVYSARLDDTGYIQKTVSTSGYTNIQLEYARYTYAYDWGEYLIVEWSDDGSNWTVIEYFNDEYSWSLNQASLGSDAEDLSTLYIRFRSNASGLYEKFRLDNVLLTGEPTSRDPDAPYFTDELIELPQLDVGEPISGSVAIYATDPNGDPMTFSKLGGPSWVSVASDGSLSGTPGSTDEGENQIAVRVTDSTSLYGDAMFSVQVGTAAAPSCLGGVSNYTFSGPYDVGTSQSGQIKFWAPYKSQLPSGCEVPIIHHANGTGATCSMYGSLLSHLASHGFIVACYESSNTGAGDQCIDAVDAAMLEFDFAADKLGFTGHSQGGGAAFICTANAEDRWGSSMQIAGHAQQPASGFGDAPYNWASIYNTINSPMFMFNGSSDWLVSSSWVGDAYDELPSGTEAYWYEAVGSTHIPVPNDESAESATAWFLWKLEGDQDACRYFKDMPSTYDWRYQASQNETACQ